MSDIRFASRRRLEDYLSIVFPGAPVTTADVTRLVVAGAKVVSVTSTVYSVNGMPVAHWAHWLRKGWFHEWWVLGTGEKEDYDVT